MENRQEGLKVKLNQLLERLEYQVAQGSDEIEITTLINDSRKVETGSVFVCISGATRTFPPPWWAWRKKARRRSLWSGMWKRRNI